MSDQSSTPLPDEPDHPLPPESTPTADQPSAAAPPPAASRSSAAAPPPGPPGTAPPTVPADATPPPSTPWGPPAASWLRRRGPRPGPLLPVATGLIGLMLGIVIGVAGHVYKSRPVIATGIGLIFIATLLLPLAVHATD